MHERTTPAHPGGGAPGLDLTGQRFGLLVCERVVVGRRGKDRGWIWECLCDCGAQIEEAGYRLRRGFATCCGCARPSAVWKMPEHAAWHSMRARCEPDAKARAYYADRGITVCERWQTFANFLADVGPRPGKGFSLDRIDNDRGYEPSNCRWATGIEQATNRRSTRLITYGNETMSVTAWSRHLGVTAATLSARVRRHGEQRAIEMTLPSGS